MHKVPITYNVYPSSKEATDYSRSRAVGAVYLSGTIGFLIVGTVIYYLYCIWGVFDKVTFSDFLKSLGGIFYSILGKPVLFFASRYNH